MTSATPHPAFGHLLPNRLFRFLVVSLLRFSHHVISPGGAVEPHKLPDGWLCELTIDENESTDRRAAVRGTNSRRASDKGMLPITLNDCLALLNASGRMLRDDKRLVDRRLRSLNHISSPDSRMSWSTEFARHFRGIKLCDTCATRRL